MIRLSQQRGRSTTVDQITANLDNLEEIGDECRVEEEISAHQGIDFARCASLQGERSEYIGPMTALRVV